MDEKFSRREAIKRISVVVGGSTATAIVLPSKWTKPIMDAVIGPAGAAFVSYCGTDGTYYSGQGPRQPPNLMCPTPTTTPITPPTTTPTPTTTGI
jgi:hypothetical protein